MIRIDRGPEPARLATLRRRYLARAVLARATGREIDFTGYQRIKRDLYRLQRGKCAYCERPQGLGSHPVEHFRPRDGALRSLPGETEVWAHDHYWWLAWSWENLLFSCVTCNGRDHKANYFPLERGTVPLRQPPHPLVGELPQECVDLASEAASLIDPAREDPMDHLRWYPVDPRLPVEQLDWMPQYRTSRGKKTRRVLRLHGGLRDHIGRHIRRVVWPRVRGLREMATGKASRQHVLAEWQAIVDDLLHPEQPFLAATHDALNYFLQRKFSAAERRRWNLVMPPRPGAGASPVISAPLFPAEPTGFDQLPHALRWRLRADEEPLPELIHALCQIGPRTTSELADLCRRSLATIQRAVRNLKNQRRIINAAGAWQAP